MAKVQQVEAQYSFAFDFPPLLAYIVYNKSDLNNNNRINYITQSINQHLYALKDVDSIRFSPSFFIFLL